MAYEYSSNPEYEDEDSGEKKSAVVAASILDDVAYALIIAGATAAGILGKRIGKIIGNVPGRMKSLVEEALKSDFRSGHSYLPRINQSESFLNSVRRFGRRGAISALIGTALLTGIVKTAYAHDFVRISGKIPIITKSKQLRTLTDYIAGISDTTAISKKNASDILFETAVHESDLLRHKRQLITKGRNLVERGVGRSIFMIEPKTAKNLVKWASTRPNMMNLLTTTSGLTAKQLTSMTRDELARYMMKHDHFSAALARIKYFSAPGKIPSTAEGRSVYWGKWYQGTNNPVNEMKYLRDNRLISKEIKASALSNVIKKHLDVKPTQGLVNNVLHERKVMHNISSNTKKAASMWQIFGRR